MNDERGAALDAMQAHADAVMELEKVTKERDELRAEIELLNRNITGMEQSSASLVWQNEAYRKSYMPKQELDEALAKCAEMRAVLEHWIRYNQADIPKNADEGEAAGEDFTAVWSETEHALSTDCGKGWVRATELDATIELLRDVIREEAYTQLGARAARERERLEALRKGAQ